MQNKYRRPEGEMEFKAMTRFYLNLHEEGVIDEDEEGKEFHDLEEARSAAIAAARDVMSAQIQEGTLCLSCSIDILDSTRFVVAQINFSDAVMQSGRPSYATL